MRWIVVIGLMLAVAWAVPARAGDDKDAVIADLRAQLSTVEAEKAALEKEAVRSEAENNHLREAYNQLSEYTARLPRSIASMTNSLNAAREMISTLQAENAKLKDALAQPEQAAQKRAVELEVKLDAANKSLAKAEAALAAVRKALK